VLVLVGAGIASGEHENVELVGRALEGPANAVVVQGDHAYLCAGKALVVLDVSDPTSPVKVGQTFLPEMALDVHVSGRYAYVADFWDGLRVIDISDPTSPSEVGYYDTEDCAHGVHVSGKYAYVADRKDGLRIIDVSDPKNPYEVGYYDTGGWAISVYVSGDYAYVADGGDGLRIIDILCICCR